MVETPSKPQGAPVMDEGAQVAPAAGSGPQTVEVPLSAIGSAKEGDTVTMKVISRDEQNGVANVVPAAAAPEDSGGTDGMADEFKPQPKM